MAYHYTNNNHNNHRTSMIAMPTNNQSPQDSYDYDVMKLLEQEQQQQQQQRRRIVAQPPLVNRPQQTQYVPSTNNIYPNVPQSQTAAQLNRRVSSLASATIPAPFSPTKPLRIIIIRHAERADAVLGSEWSKKSFDRTGRYIRFSEHLPEKLPTRSYLHHYVIDVPLTNRGRIHAFRTGKTLLHNGYAADICYTSPSLRCVQSANELLTGMDRKSVSMQLEPGLFECYLNDFKRTLCFMTKDELAANGYNIDQSYQTLMPFMRPHDSQLDYYARCQAIMNIITERHQTTGGTILIVAHAPSLEGLTRHFSGMPFQPEKLFDIARRVPFLAMTIVERNSIDSPWLFRTQPLQTESIRETMSRPSVPSTTGIAIGHNHSINPHEQQHLQRQHQQKPSPIQTASVASYHNSQQQQQRLLQTANLRHDAVVYKQQQLSQTQPAAVYSQQRQQRQEQIQNLRHGVPPSTVTVDPKKVVKSSTAPNLPTSNSLSEMFRVI